MAILSPEKFISLSSYKLDFKDRYISELAYSSVLNCRGGSNKEGGVETPVEKSCNGGVIIKGYWCGFSDFP